MMYKTLMLIGLLGAHVNGETLRKNTERELVEHLDLEMEIEGERQLFPLLPGVKCPKGFNCRVRDYSHVDIGLMPAVANMKNNFKTSLSATVDWQELNSNFNTLVDSDDRCSRRGAMKKAAGLIAGISAAAVGKPAYAAETKEVLMGADSGLLVFVPAKTQICKGDSVKWINNKAGPHNVVFDEDAIPEGVSQEAISMDDQLGEPGDSFTMKFDTAGTYEYYCEPHRGAGMQATLTVV